MKRKNIVEILEEICEPEKLSPECITGDDFEAWLKDIKEEVGGDHYER